MSCQSGHISILIGFPGALTPLLTSWNGIAPCRTKSHRSCRAQNKSWISKTDTRAANEPQSSIKCEVQGEQVFENWGGGCTVRFKLNISGVGSCTERPGLYIGRIGFCTWEPGRGAGLCMWDAEGQGPLQGILCGQTDTTENFRHSVGGR